jgi:hypothetical protein
LSLLTLQGWPPLLMSWTKLASVWPSMDVPQGLKPFDCTAPPLTTWYQPLTLWIVYPPELELWRNRTARSAGRSSAPSSVWRITVPVKSAVGEMSPVCVKTSEGLEDPLTV